MSKTRCQLCDRGPQTGNTVSHSNRRNKRRFKLNIVQSKGRSICTSCLRTESKILV